MKENYKYFEQTEDPMKQNTIEKIIGEDETILWRGQPKKSAYIAAAVLKMLPIAIIFGVVDFGVIFGVFIHIEGLPWFVYLFFAVHLIPVWVWIAGIVHAVVELKNIDYVITDKRIIIRSGIVVDLKFLYYTDIENVKVKVNLIDRMLKVGDIYLTASSQTAVLYDISNPYKVVNFIQKVVRDIQTDIHFPNAYRPSENTGYNTKYMPNFNGDSNKDID